MPFPSVYKEFLTNTAVAWFTAGVISPIFTGNLDQRDAITSFISVTMCIVFLVVARNIEKKNKYDKSK